MGAYIPLDTYLTQFGFELSDIKTLPNEVYATLAVPKMFNVLLGFGFTQDQIIKMVLRYNNLLILHKHQVEGRLDCLKLITPTTASIIKLAYDYPAVLSSNSDTVLERYDSMQKRSKYPDQRLQVMICKLPALLGYEPDRMLEHMNFFDHLGIPYDEKPHRFMTSPRLLRGRYMVLHKQRKIGRPNLLFVSNKQFEAETGYERGHVIMFDPGSGAKLP